MARRRPRRGESSDAIRCRSGTLKPGPREGFRWTRETIIYAFELWHRHHLCSPTVAEWRRAGESHPSVTTVRTVFGSWNSAVAAAGLRPRRPGEARKGHALVNGTAETAVRWPKRRVLARLHSWAQEHGRPPTLEEWRRAGETHPSAATVRRLFGTWNAALVAAGFEARRPGVPLLPRSLTHRRCESSGRWVSRVA